jgi:hypothetical protein
METTMHEVKNTVDELNGEEDVSQLGGVHVHVCVCDPKIQELEGISVLEFEGVYI